MGYIPMEFPDTISGASEAQAFKWKSFSHLDFELVTQRRSGPPNHSGQVKMRDQQSQNGCNNRQSFVDLEWTATGTTIQMSKFTSLTNI